ncbi:hypothetical protein ACT3UD_16095, partial [Glutamicibacter sp. 287]|uniref:hypothetical protein n=1 Tax=unclassified Glutamicibacter TaxID=2627139 RepID=UPI004034A7FC
VLLILFCIGTSVTVLYQHIGSASHHFYPLLSKQAASQVLESRQVVKLEDLKNNPVEAMLNLP